MSIDIRKRQGGGGRLSLFSFPLPLLGDNLVQESLDEGLEVVSVEDALLVKEASDLDLLGDGTPADMRKC